MSRKLFEHALLQLQDDVLLLGSMTEKSLKQSVGLLGDRDFEGSRELIHQDRIIDERPIA